MGEANAYKFSTKVETHSANGKKIIILLHLYLEATKTYKVCSVALRHSKTL